MMELCAQPCQLGPEVYLIGITLAFLDPQCEHFHWRQFTINGKGVLSDRLSLSRIRSAPCPQLTSLQETRNRMTPWVRR